MFKILIIEDNTDKLRNIMQLLEGLQFVDNNLIDHEIDSDSAKQKLKNNYYDLLIVDIAIPARKSYLVENDGGIKLVREILMRDNYNIPSHIIGLTALNEVFEEATKEFGNQSITVIRYSDTDDEWQEKLKNGIAQWTSAKASSNAIKEDYNYDVAIITAVDVEFDAVKNLSSSWKRINVANDPTMYWETTFETPKKTIKVVAACASQMGMIASTALSMKLIYNFRPRYIMMPGIAATLKGFETHGFGDVIIIDETWDGGAGKISETVNGDRIFNPVAKHLRGDLDLTERARGIKDDTSLLRSIKDSFKPNKVPNTELLLHIGSAVSVSGVIENSEVTKELKAKDRKLVGLEMESYGVYYAAHNCSKPRPKALAMKAISDFADTNKVDDYQTYASFTSSKILHHIITNECDFD